MTIKTAMHRVRQRSKLPSGDRIVTVRCECGTPMYLWSDAIRPGQRCSYCILADRAEKAAVWGGR